MVKPVTPQTLKPVTPQSATLVQNTTVAPVVAPQTLSATAPSGPVLSQAPCCPDVATFEGSTGPRTSYFGFDDKTNLVANVGADEYWIPPTDAKTLPSSKEERDGARWVSVGVGREAQVEISFGGTFTNTCLGNCTYDVDPASVAEVSNPIPTASGVAFKIKGKAAGEASVKVMCDGKLRGYFYIWCIQPASIDIDLASIVTPNSAAVGYSASDIEAYLNEVYRQVLITFNVNDVGAVTVAPTITSYINNPSDPRRTGHLQQMDRLMQAGSTSFAATYRIYYYVNTAPHASSFGTVPNGLGNAGPAYCFIGANLPVSYNTIAHEVGHLLGLSHPIHDSDKDEFPVWQHLRFRQRTTAAGLRNTNVLLDDPWNLMGYEGPTAQRAANRKPLRYRQWKKCKRT